MISSALAAAELHRWVRLEHYYRQASDEEYSCSDYLSTIFRSDSVRLDLLDCIPWGLLQTARGPAIGVPSALRGLCNPDLQVRQQAYWQLDNVVVLQSDLYEAAAYVPPFLISLLLDGTCPGMDFVLDLLYEIGNGAAPATEYLRFSVAPSGEVQYYAEDRAPQLGHACRDAVRLGIPHYQKLAMNASQKMIRAKAKDLLASLDSIS